MRKGWRFGFFLIVILEVCIALWVNDGFVRPYLGDVLAAAALCCLAKGLFPKAAFLFPGVFLLCAAVELMQALQLAQLWQLQGFWRILLGSTFDFWDIVCYFAGTALTWILSKRMDQAS